MATHTATRTTRTCSSSARPPQPTRARRPARAAHPRTARAGAGTPTTVATGMATARSAPTANGCPRRPQTTSRAESTTRSSRPRRPQDTTTRCATAPRYRTATVEGVAPSGVIYANSSSPSDAELTTIIAAAHALNLTVKLRPTIDPRWEVSICVAFSGVLQ